ncbi:MAG: hypothetical protein RLY58_673 [Pseudomonadota bacterium]|jgi:hypothetical protein
MLLTFNAAKVITSHTFEMPYKPREINSFMISLVPA